MLAAFDEIINHINQRRTFAFQIRRKQGQNHIILNVSVKFRKTQSIALLVQRNITHQMTTGAHACGSAAGKDLLDVGLTANHLVTFKKLYRQKRNLCNRFYLLNIHLQIIAKSSVYCIVLVLMSEHFKRQFVKSFATV